MLKNVVALGAVGVVRCAPRRAGTAERAGYVTQIQIVRSAVEGFGEKVVKQAQSKGGLK
jgi:hypothetical protein